MTQWNQIKSSGTMKISTYISKMDHCCCRLEKITKVEAYYIVRKTVSDNLSQQPEKATIIYIFTRCRSATELN